MVGIEDVQADERLDEGVADKRPGYVKFAEKLVSDLGLDAALRACRENNWDGVFQQIQRRYII